MEALASVETSGEIIERIHRGLMLELHKTIPSQAGLGGGSSDAACVLTALNALWELGIPETHLEALGASLGSDAPFFVSGGTALIEGRGEFVSALPDAEPFWLVLVKPRIGVSTAAVFRALTPSDFSDETETLALVSAIRAGRPLAFDRLANTLEAGVLRAYPAVSESRAALLAAGAPAVRMSGSGPTLFAPFRTLAEATAVYQRLRAMISDPQAMEVPCDAWLCHTISRAQFARARPTPATLLA
ncbi:MAG TPA: 4-(cytidine 5'-diphospho)-2-C-methyl-D-erythritol kinase, partial [Ktedonobacterales bacterium]|nr:4-(cytidine 5'-diphospho)-2-C-methyl-D-erythritol kinase [Ktedonobacterales bacterium]